MTDEPREQPKDDDAVELSETASEIRESAKRLEKAADRIERKADAGSGYQGLSGQDEIPPGKVPEGDDD